VPEHDHSFDRHVPHRVIDSTDVETGVSVASERHPVDAKRRMVVDHDGHPMKPSPDVERAVRSIREKRGRALNVELNFQELLASGE
jgi:hypothetical protein